MARRRRWIPVLFLLVLLLSPPAFVGASWWRAHLKLQSLLEVLPDPALKVWLAEYRRPSLFGDPVEGNGCAHYDRVARELDASPEVREQVGGIPNSAYPVRFPPPADLARLRDDHRAWIDGIFLGLRCTKLRRSADYLAGADIGDSEALLLACAEAERQAGRDAEALRLLAAILAFSGDAKRGGTPDIVLEDMGARCAAVLWRVVLSSHALAASELESACRLLDRIEEVRPTIFDAIRNHHEARRATILSNYLKSEIERPGWRHLWSRTVRACELADDVDRNCRAFLALESRPSWERQDAVAAMDDAIEAQDALWLEFPAGSVSFDRESVGRSMRDLIRIATALAWHEAETGRMPERLGDLVPRFLPREPVCAASGKPFPYERGVLTTPPEIQSGFSREAGGVDWPIRRR